jgi:uncharacterized RDD family membrane protein YckC
MAGGPVALPPELLPSLARRTIATVVDALIIVFTIMVLAVVHSAVAPPDRFGAPDHSGASRAIALAALAVLVLGPTLLHAVFVRLGGATPGHRLVGVRVVDADGGTIGFRRAILRGIGWQLGLLSLGWGLRVARWDANRAAWTDDFGGTVVVGAGHESEARARLAAGPPAPATPVTFSDEQAEPDGTGPTSGIPASSLCDLLLDRHHWAEAAAAIRTTAGDDDTIALLGVTLAVTRADRTATWLNQLAVTRGDAGLHSARALRLALDGHTDAADRVLQERDEHTRWWWLARAAAARGAGDDVAADEACRAAEAAGVDEFVVASTQASVCEGAERWIDAVRWRRRAIDLAPWDPREQALGLALACHRNREVRRAVRTVVDDDLLVAWATFAIDAAPTSSITQFAVQRLSASSLRTRPRPARPERVLAFERFLEAHQRRNVAAANGRHFRRPIAPPPGTIYADQASCRCATLWNVTGASALGYLDRHLAVAGPVQRLSAVVATCPDTGGAWFALDGSEPESLGRGVVLVRLPDVVGTTVEPTRGSWGYL